MQTPLIQLNDDIWRPFSDAYTHGDVERYLAIHAPDFTWVRAAAGIIEGLDDYAARTRASFADMAGRGIRVGIGFRFTERIASASRASERGVFRLSGDGPKGPLPELYGRFHTIARRGDDGWRLVVDYEYPDDGTVDAADFASASAP